MQCNVVEVNVPAKVEMDAGAYSWKWGKRQRQATTVGIVCSCDPAKMSFVEAGGLSVVVP